MLDIKYPIIGGGMTIISNSILASAISKAGALGVIATGSMNTEELLSEIEKVDEKSLGVNIVDMHFSIDEIIESVKNIKIVFIAGTKIKKEWIKTLHNKNILCAAFASSVTIAQYLEKIGIDIIVIEGMEAGGHINGVTTMVLMQEILPHVSVPVIAAGGVGNGRGLFAYLSMGASACQLGTRFVCAKESIAHENFKNVILKAKSRDTYVSSAINNNFSVIPVRAIKNKAHIDFNKLQYDLYEKVKEKKISLQKAQLEIEMFWVGSLKNAAVKGNIDTGSVMAGQISGIIKNKTQSVKEIIMEIMQDAYERVRVIKNCV